MSQLPNWESVPATTNNYDEQLGVASTPEVWKYKGKDLYVVMFKDPSVDAYALSVDGSDQFEAEMEPSSLSVTSRLGSRKSESRKEVTQWLRDNPNPFGLLQNPDDLHNVHFVGDGQYHTQGLGASKYARLHAEAIADWIQEDTGIQATVMRDRKRDGYNVLAVEPVSKQELRDMASARDQSL